jgi:excisionase family DNA binding protein
MIRLLTARTVSVEKSIPLSTLYKMVRESSIPHVRLGKAVRFPADALEEWFAAQVRYPTLKRDQLSSGRSKCG